MAEHRAQERTGSPEPTGASPRGGADGVGQHHPAGASDQARARDRSGTRDRVSVPTGAGGPGTEVVLEAAPTVPGETASRVGFTAAAVELLRELWDEHGPVMFHQSGGCCDGSAPMCFPAGEFRTGDADVLLGTAQFTTADGGALGGVDFWISAEQFEVWRRTRLVIDAVPGRGSGFSLETPTGHRFLTRSELCTGRA